MKKTIEDLVEEHRHVRKTQRSPEWSSWNKALAAIETDLLERALMSRIGKRDADAWREAQKIVAEQLDTSIYAIKNRRNIFAIKDLNLSDEIWRRLDAGQAMTDAVRNVRDDKKSKSRRAFWSDLRQRLAQHVKAELDQVPEDQVERSVADFEKDLSALVDYHKNKWKKLASEKKSDTLVSRARFCNALRTLHLDPPRRGTPLIDVLGRAAKQKRVLARAYHPDANAGSDKLRPQYQAVLEAYLVVEQYVRENEAPARPRLRVVEGGKND